MNLTLAFHQLESVFLLENIRNLNFESVQGKENAIYMRKFESELKWVTSTWWILDCYYGFYINHNNFAQNMEKFMKSYNVWKKITIYVHRMFKTHSIGNLSVLFLAKRYFPFENEIVVIILVKIDRCECPFKQENVFLHLAFSSIDHIS